jgi:hypothetical protein
MTRILRHLKLASVPPPIAPARCRQEKFAWVDEAHADEAHAMAHGLGGDVRAAEGCLTPLSLCNAFAIPCEILPPQPAKTALGEAFAPDTPCGFTRTDPARHVQAAMGRGAPLQRGGRSVRERVAGVPAPKTFPSISGTGLRHWKRFKWARRQPSLR